MVHSLIAFISCSAACILYTLQLIWKYISNGNFPDSETHMASVGPTWCCQNPGGPHVGHTNLAIWVLNIGFHVFYHILELVMFQIGCANNDWFFWTAVIELNLSGKDVHSNIREDNNILILIDSAYIWDEWVQNTHINWNVTRERFLK